MHTETEPPSPTAPNHLGPFKLLPCAPGVCQECATDHDPQLPHNQQSLYWQYKFYNAHGRWPTWDDAMAHCTPRTQELWRHASQDDRRRRNGAQTVYAKSSEGWIRCLRSVTLAAALPLEIKPS